jgi:hypothetical protein
LEVRRKHLGVEAISLGRGAVFVVIILIFGSPVEIGGAFVFVRTTVLPCHVS